MATAPILARAQTTEAAAGTTVGAWISSISTSVLMPTTTIGGIVWLIVVLTRPSAPPPPAAAKAVQHYLEQNGDQLAQDLALGSGPVIDDLASSYQIGKDNRAAFGRMLRADRARLLDLGDRARLSPDRAVEFVRHVGDLVRGDSVLAADFAVLANAG